jgi:hypothetical protein
MAKTIESPKEKQYGLLEQATWGTAIAESSSVLKIDTAGFTIDPDVKIRESNQSHGTRRPYVGELIAHTNRSAPLIGVPSIEAKQGLLDYFLYLLFQSVTEGAVTPYSKTFSILDVQPDFSVSAGMFATLWERFADANTSRKVKDVIGKSITLSCAPGEPLMVSVELVGRGAVTETENPSATWTRPTDNFWYWEQIDRATLNWGAGLMDLTLQGFEISMSHAAIPYGNDGAGNFETFGVTNWDLGFKLKVGEDITQDIRTNFLVALKAGTDIIFNIGWGNASPGTVDGDLDLAWRGRVTKVTPHLEEILGIDVEGKILTTAVGTSPITIIMANAIDRTW